MRGGAQRRGSIRGALNTGCWTRDSRLGRSRLVVLTKAGLSLRSRRLRPKQPRPLHEGSNTSAPQVLTASILLFNNLMYMPLVPGMTWGDVNRQATALRAHEDLCGAASVRNQRLKMSFLCVLTTC